MTQRDLFGFDDMRPKLSLKKIITKERLEEVKRLLDKHDDRSAVEKLEDLRDELEKLDRRLSNRKPK